MDNPPDNPESQTTSYVETQFFFYMLACYYAIIAFSFRYNKLMKQPPEINVNRLPGQFLITCFQNQPQFVPGVSDSPPCASYVIKSKLCLFNSYLYLFMTLFSLVGTPDVFYGSKQKKYSLLYLFGFVAWSLAAIVLRRQYQRKINQSLWTHRIFWIFSGTLAITKMFEDYLLPMNLILNCFSIATNCVLAIYGIYRPQDNDTLTLIDNQDIPGIFKLFFQYVELNTYVRKVLKIQDHSSSNFKQQVDPQNLGEIDVKTLEQAFKVTTESRRQQINLLNQLPRRNIFIDKKLQYIKNANNTIKICYFIITQIGNNRYQILRTYKQFMKLQQDLQQVFNDRNFPRLSLPKIKKESTNPNNNEYVQNSTNKSDVLEQWLAQLIKKPLFLIKPLLTFLNVNEQSSAPFVTYFEISYKSFCSNAFMVAQLRKKQALKQNNRVSLVGYYDDEGQSTNATTKSIRIGAAIKQKLQFLVEIDDQITEVNQFGFLLTCVRETKNKQRIRWKLRKYEQNILAVNYRIEEECRISVPFYYQMISNISKKNHQLKAKSYCEYINKLFVDQKYYCLSLFQFIRFDPIAMEVKISGMDMGLKNEEKQKNNRTSHYFQQYDDQMENLVSIQRVDRINCEKDGDKQKVIYKFQIRRKSFVLNRTSEEILELRKDLAEIYQGVSYVTCINYDECNKNEARERTQKFLKFIQNLPKILINESFGKFYQHTL